MNLFYNEFRSNVHSQNGEDGVIAEIIRRLDIDRGWVCEFGAWDGVHLSNTFNLLKNKKFEGVFIEGDKKKYSDLLETVKTHQNIVPINAYVDHRDTANSLDNLLKKTSIPEDYDILSIDIDSFDYQVWDSHRKYRPKIVIIEINSSVSPDHADWIHEPGRYEGTAFLPMLRLGHSKAYKFVCHTGNMIFVRDDIYDQLRLPEADPLENFIGDWL